MPNAQSATRSIKIRKASPSTTPITLTHYTDLTGLQGIVENRELWLSNAAFLNDPEELNHGVKRANQVLKRLLKEEPTDKVSKARLKLVADIADDFTEFQTPDAYIACFCERRDLLSQWRGYASRQGVSITFDTSGLTGAFNDMGAELQQVAYGINDTTKQLQTAIKRELPDIVDDVDYMLGTLQDEEIRRNFADLMAKLIPRFKHFGFREEKEWRLIATNPVPAKINFRPRGQLMLPYIKLRSKKKKLPIDEVTIGPGVNDEAVMKSIQF
jgi:hypothetical protein